MWCGPNKNSFDMLGVSWIRFCEVLSSGSTKQLLVTSTDRYIPLRAFPGRWILSMNPIYVGLFVITGHMPFFWKSVLKHKLGNRCSSEMPNHPPHYMLAPCVSKIHYWCLWLSSCLHLHSDGITPYYLSSDDLGMDERISL